MYSIGTKVKVLGNLENVTAKGGSLSVTHDMMDSEGEIKAIVETNDWYGLEIYKLKGSDDWYDSSHIELWGFKEIFNELDGG